MPVKIDRRSLEEVDPSGRVIDPNTFSWQFRVSVDISLLALGELIEPRACHVNVECTDKDHPHGNYDVAETVARRIADTFSATTNVSIYQNPARSYWQKADH